MSFTTTDAKRICYDRTTKDYAAYYENQVIGFYGSYLEAEEALDEFVSDLARQTAIEDADMEADGDYERAEALLTTEPRAYSCFVDDCRQPPRHMYGDAPLCCAHYAERTGAPCGCQASGDILTMYRQAYGWAHVTLDALTAPALDKAA